jgi:O-antigen/teichoic acid export membrane protein
MGASGFGSSYILLLINEGIYSFSAVIVSIVLGRFLGASELGLFAMVTAYMVLYLEICSLGVDITLVREYSKKTISIRTLMKTIYLMRLPLTFFGAGLYVVTLYFLKVNGYLISICAAVLLLRSAKLLINALFFSKKRVSEIVASDVLFSVSYLVFFFFSIFVLENGVAGVFVAQLIALAGSFVFSIRLLHKSGILREQLASDQYNCEQRDCEQYNCEDDSLRKVFNQVKWFSVNPILGTVQGKLSFYVLSIVSVPVNIGLVSVGEMFKSILFRLFNGIFSKLLLPSFGEVHKSKAEIDELFYKSNTFFAVASLIMVVLALPLIKPFILWAYGREYAGSVLLARLFVLEGMLFTLSLSETTIIKLYREDLSARISILGFVICLPVTLFFYHFFELKGLVFASFLITLVRLLYGTGLCSSILKIKLLDTYIPQLAGIYFLIALYLFCEVGLISMVMVDLAMVIGALLVFLRTPGIFMNMCRMYGQEEV